MAASVLNLILKERKNKIPDAGGKIPDLVLGCPWDASGMPLGCLPGHRDRQECQNLDKIMESGPNQVHVAAFELIFNQNESHRVWEGSGMPPGL